jgi:hypothetical protein
MNPFSEFLLTCVSVTFAVTFAANLSRSHAMGSSVLLKRACIHRILKIDASLVACGLTNVDCLLQNEIEVKYQSA